MTLNNKIFYLDNVGIHDCSKKVITYLGSKGTGITFDLKLFDRKIQNLKVGKPTLDFIICILNVDFLRKRDIEVGLKPLFFPDDEIFEDLKNVRPILFTGLMDLFLHEEEDKGIKRDEAMKRILDPRYRFFDSCIWFRYVPLNAFDDNIDEDNRIIKVLKYFEEKLDLYKSNGAREFRDFQIRLFNESFVARFDFHGSHAGHIVPFGFHSETKMEKYSAEEFGMINSLDKDNKQQFKWSVLLVDDYGDKGITHTEITKGNLIKNLIGSKFLVTENLNYAVSVSDGMKFIRDENNSFDIILLDYYFEKDNDIPEQFGESFLLELFDPKIPDENNPNFHKSKLGHHGKYWIFPVSVYGNALGDKLKENKITWYDDKWVFSPGGDPINTPNLFQYKIYSFMRRQLEEYTIMGYEVKDSKICKSKLLYSELERVINLIIYNGTNEINEDIPTSDLLDKIKHIKECSINTQRNAFYFFPKIVELGSKFKRLNNFRKNNELAESIIKKYFFNMDYIDWDHLQHLVYLLAYGNLSDHNLIWSEAAYIKDRIGNMKDSKIVDENKVLSTFINAVLKYLEK